MYVIVRDVPVQRIISYFSPEVAEHFFIVASRSFFCTGLAM
ncbi:MAG TPA: hypothetical protein VN455_02615 [Methanotrichaceae archaeon]|nr:hypothetical protein [Methanotrichaceae archaeon]